MSVWLYLAAVICCVSEGQNTPQLDTKASLSSDVQHKAEGIPSPFCPNITENDEQIFYIHPSNCSIYYLCSHGLAYEFVCPAKLHFNLERKVCDYERFARCKKVDMSGCSPGQPKMVNAVEQGLQGDLYSPGYKEGVYYPDNLRCEYNIEAPEGFKIRLKFVDLVIDAIDFCEDDFLAVLEGIPGNIGLHGIFCGNQAYPDILSLGNTLKLIFSSNFMIGKKGFHLQYKVSFSKNLCSDNQRICKNRNCFNTSNICDGKDDCGDGTDEENCGYSLANTTCGKRLNDSATITSLDRVVGGQEAIPYSWPWQADLQISGYYPNSHMCGGTLINAQWVVSAAHCFKNKGQPGNWRVHLGNHRKFFKDRHEQVRFVEKIIAYPDLVDEAISSEKLYIYNEDFALMKLNAPVIFTDQVRPACLPAQGFELKTNTNCMATGWGQTRGTGSNDALKEIELTIQDNNACVAFNIPMNNKTGICVLNRKENQGVCHGDSGGPLVCKINGEWQILGATSRGTRHTFQQGFCGIAGSYTIYSKVSDKIEWINKMINTYS